jgi:hypothetical protein
MGDGWGDGSLTFPINPREMTFNVTTQGKRTYLHNPEGGAGMTVT